MSSARQIVKAVVDTNLFVSGTILKRGRSFELLEAWRQGAFTLVMAHEQRAELADVLTREHIAVRYRVTAEDVEALFRRIADLAMDVVVGEPSPVTVRDPQDEPILATAIFGEADYLVTGDKDLLVLRDDSRLRPLRIVTVEEFLRELPAEQ